MDKDKLYVVKCHIPGCLHKTDIGGVLLKVNTTNFDELLKPFVSNLTSKGLEGIIIVEMC